VITFFSVALVMEWHSYESTIFFAEIHGGGSITTCSSRASR
jgi:hypothetical protein